MGKVIPLRTLSMQQLDDDRSKAEAQYSELERLFWEAWRWRRRLRCNAFPHLVDGRRSIVLGHVDALFDYVELQRAIIHQLISVASQFEGKVPAAQIYRELLGVASRYDLEGRLLSPTRRGGK